MKYHPQLKSGDGRKKLYVVRYSWFLLLLFLPNVREVDLLLMHAHSSENGMEEGGGTMLIIVMHFCSSSFMQLLKRSFLKYGSIALV